MTAVVGVVAAVALVLALALAVAVAGLLTGRRRLERELVGAREDLDALAQRLGRLERGAEPVEAAGRSDVVPHVITSLADPAAPDDDQDHRLTGREFVSVALGESLLKAAALVHGVRRASSAENRNRIRFEMSREVKRQRRQHRLDLRLARRRLREEQLRRNAADESLREDAA